MLLGGFVRRQTREVALVIARFLLYTFVEDVGDLGWAELVSITSEK